MSKFFKKSFLKYILWSNTSNNIQHTLKESCKSCNRENIPELIGLIYLFDRENNVILLTAYVIWEDSIIELKQEPLTCAKRKRK